MARRALVVDDDPLVLETVVSMLEELGCETIPARSGGEALGQLARDQSVQILVADINMPGLSGSSTSRAGTWFSAGTPCYPVVRPRK
jgi:CheY-like chemotaxis protein